MKKSNEYLEKLIKEAKMYDDRLAALESVVQKQKFFSLGKGFWEFHLNNLKKLIEDEEIKKP